MFQCSKKRKTNLLKRDDFLTRRPQLLVLLFRFWSSKSLFAILSIIQYIINFQSVFWTSKYFSTSDESPIFAVSNLSFIILVYRQPWKLLTNLFGCCSRTVSVLLLFVLLSIFCSEITHQLGLDLTPSLMSQEPKRLLLLLFNVRLSQVNPVNNIAPRCI